MSTSASNENKTSLVTQKRSNALPPPPKDEIAKILKISQVSVEWLAGDGSDRCYYRLRSDDMKSSLVLMQLSGSDAEALRANGYDWIKVADILKEHCIVIPTPRIAMSDYAALLIDDYGDVMLEAVVQKALDEDKEAVVDGYYDECFDIIAKLLQIPRSDDVVWCQRAFDAEKYVWELQFFWKQFVEPVADLEISPNEKKQFDIEVDDIARYLAKYSQFFTHRDFHSRNIMVKDKTLALIDFQDARLGNCAYDLVSLTYDNYIPLPAKKRQDLCARGVKRILERVKDLDSKDFESVLEPTILQRQLKAIGTYGFLTVNKKRGNYLRYVQPALESLRALKYAQARWPFLQETLIEKLDRSLKKKGAQVHDGG